METSRRSFLAGILSLSALPLLPSISLASVPVIWGDGIHDDAPGLNALFAGDSFIADGGGFTATDGLLRGGTFRICASLTIKRPNFLIQNCHFLSEVLDQPTFNFDQRTINVRIAGNPRALPPGKS